MKHYYRVSHFLLLLVGILALSGCATSSLQTQAKMTRSISLNPDQLKDKRLYLRITGTQASKIELEMPLKKALAQRGVSVVENSDDATWYLHIDTLFADNLKEAARLDVALFGGMAAGAISTLNNSGGDSLLIGVGVALAMGIADRALADETYRAVINVSLQERDHSSRQWKPSLESRLFVEAVRMGLNLDEAKPIMEEKASYQIAEIFR